jgi:hypothetical protein
MHEFGHALGFWHEKMRDGTLGCNGVNDGVFPGQKYGGKNVDGIMSDCDSGPAAAGITRLNSLDQAAIQRAYGRRIKGQLVSTNGRCLASFGNSTGEQPFMWDCDEFQDDQEWDFTFFNGNLKMHGLNLCLSAPALNSNTQTATCNSTDFKMRWFVYNNYIRAYGKCLDLDGGNTNGGGVQAWDCGAADWSGNPGGFQKWFVPLGSTTPTIQFANVNQKCLTAPAAGSGQLTVTDCNGSNLQQFIFVGGQIVSNAFPTKCLDIMSELDSSYMSGNGGPANGQPVQLFSCTSAQFNQKWSFSGQLLNNQFNGCLTRLNDGNGAKLQVQNCSSSTNQVFDYYGF